MKTFIVNGENQYINCQIDSDQMLYAKNFNRWLQHQGDDALTDTINL